MKRLKVGDIVEIPLSNGQRAFAQYVTKDKMGPLIQVFNLIAEPDEVVSIEQLEKIGPLFPPVITGLYAMVRTELWRIIGHLPITDFQYQNFISSIYNEKLGKYGVWYLWDGSESVPIGHDLPQAYHQLERLIVWHPLNLVKRIETGDNSYAYPRHGI